MNIRPAAPDNADPETGGPAFHSSICDCLASSTKNTIRAIMARPGVGSPMLYHRATTLKLNDYEFGQYLHYYQDTYSHAGYSDSYWGHAEGNHSVDKTASDVDKAIAMAKGTSEELSKYSMLKCGCPGAAWDDFTEATVRNFASVPTRFPRAADINGNIAGPSTDSTS